MAELKKREGYKVVNGRYVKDIKRDIKAKAKKSWPHLGKKTVVGKDVELSPSEYHYALDRELVEESPNQPRMLEGGVS